MGAICLGPMGNTQRGHWLFSLTSGCRVVHHCWTALPMPQEVILCVSQIGHAQGIPSCITYVNRRGEEISNHLEDFFMTTMPGHLIAMMTPTRRMAHTNIMKMMKQPSPMMRPHPLMTMTTMIRRATLTFQPMRCTTLQSQNLPAL